MQSDAHLHPQRPPQNQATQTQAPQTQPAQTQAPRPCPTTTTAKMSLSNLVESIPCSKVCPSPTDLTRDHVAEDFPIFFDFYAVGLQRFFETTWYQTNRPKLEVASPLLHIWAAFHRSMRPDYPHSEHTTRIEVQLVWELATRALATKPGRNVDAALVADDDAIEIRNRVLVFDALMSGRHVAENMLLDPRVVEDPQKWRQFKFWFDLAEVLRIRPGSSQTAEQLVGLDSLRQLLDGRENRDVLYSIVVLRVLGLTYRNCGVTVNEYKNEGNLAHRWAIAHDLIRNEIKPTGGTTPVVRKFCEMAYQAFVEPGMNCESQLSL